MSTSELQAVQAALTEMVEVFGFLDVPPAQLRSLHEKIYRIGEATRSGELGRFFTSRHCQRGDHDDCSPFANFCRCECHSRLANGAADIFERNRRVRTELEDANRQAVANALRSCAQTIFENQMGFPDAADYLQKYADTVLSQRSQPADPATESGSQTKKEPLADPQPIKRYAEAERGRWDTPERWQQLNWTCPTCHWSNYPIRSRCRGCDLPSPDFVDFQRSQPADPATKAGSQTKNEAADLRVKFEGTLRGLDSIIEAHDYSPAIGCCLGNLRIDLVDLGRQMQKSDNAKK